MRFDFDPRKSHALKQNPRRGIGFEEAQEIFEKPYCQDQISDVPEQYRAIGWANNRLYTIIFEIREAAEGDFYHLVTLGSPPSKRRNNMPKTLEATKPISADEIADLADKGEDISRFFTNDFKRMPGIQRVNVDLTLPMLEELDRAAIELNISRQAVIKTLLRQSLDQSYLARKARTA